MPNEKGYDCYWAEDVLIELGYSNFNDKNAVDWVLRWMNRHGYNPEEESVTAMSDKCQEDFLLYIEKRKNRK